MRFIIRHQKNEDDSVTVTLKNLVPNTKYWIDAASCVTSGGTDYYDARDDHTLAYATTSGFPGFKGSPGSITASSAKITVKLTSAPASAITKIRVTWGKTKKAAGSGSNSATRTVNLSKKNASAILSIKSLKASTKYYFQTSIGVVSGGKTYWYVSSGYGYFTTKSKTSTSGLNDEEERDCVAAVGLPTALDPVEGASRGWS